MSLDDLPETRDVPAQVLECIALAFKSFDSIGYAGDSDLIHAYINIGDHSVILELVLGVEGNSLEREYLINSVWYQGHDLLAEDLKSFLDYGRDLKRLTFLEIRLAALFNTIPAAYNDVERGLNDDEQRMVEDDGAGSYYPDQLPPKEADLDQAVEATYAEPMRDMATGYDPVRDLLDNHRFAAEQQLTQVNATKLTNGDDAQGAHPKAASESTLTPAKARLHPMFIFCGSALISGLAAYPAVQYLAPLLYSRATYVKPNVARSSMPTILPVRRSVPSVSVVTATTVTQCPQISVTAMDNERGVGPVLRRMQDENRNYFKTRHLAVGTIVTQAIRPRHIAEAAERNPNDSRHALGEMHHYRFGRVVSGDQFIVQTCTPQAPVFTHVRQGVTLYSFSLR